MFVYSHAVVGAALGALVRNTKSAMLWGAGGGVLPDVPMGVQIGITLLSGHSPWHIKWSSATVTISDALHSLPLCSLLLVCGWSRPQFRALALGLVSHSLMDAMTHTVTPDFKASYMWPLKWQLGSLIGIWEYRRAKDALVPKLPEVILDVAAGAVVAVKVRQRQKGVVR